MRKNKLLAITRVKNEADIIEAFVRHHACYFDRIIALDDGSSDGTYEILGRLQAEGLPVILIREATIGYDQRRYMTRLLAMAVHQFGADWVAPLDADEFIEPPEGATLESLLAACGEQLVSIGWSNFVWQPGLGEEVNPVVRLGLRLPRRSDHPKVLVPAALLAHGDAELLQGNHELVCDGVRIPAEPLGTLELCHYPIRSVEQYASKIAIGHLQYTTAPERRPGEGFHYAAPFAALKSGMDRFEALMEGESRRYSADTDDHFETEAAGSPLRYRGGPLRYTPSRIDFLANILGQAEVMAELLARERRRAR